MSRSLRRSRPEAFRLNNKQADCDNFYKLFNLSHSFYFIDLYSLLDRSLVDSLLRYQGNIPRFHHYHSASCRGFFFMKLAKALLLRRTLFPRSRSQRFKLALAALSRLVTSSQTNRRQLTQSLDLSGVLSIEKLGLLCFFCL